MQRAPALDASGNATKRRGEGGESVMNWRSVATGLERLIVVLSGARRLRDGSAVPRGIRAGAFAASLVLLPALPVAAGESYPAPGFFADGLTPQSSWEQILKKYPGIQAEFPMVNFGKTFVPLSAVCLAGDMLRIGDPRIDNGVGVPAEGVREQARAAMSGGVAARVDRFAAAGPGSVPDPQHAGIRYPVSIYKVIPRLTIERVFLFEKPWDIPSCPGR